MEPERTIPPRFPDNLPSDASSDKGLVRDRHPGIACAHRDAKSAARQAKAAAKVLPPVNLQFSKGSQLGYSPALDNNTDTTTRVVATNALDERHDGAGFYQDTDFQGVRRSVFGALGRRR